MDRKPEDEVKTEAEASSGAKARSADAIKAYTKSRFQGDIPDTYLTPGSGRGAGWAQPAPSAAKPIHSEASDAREHAKREKDRRTRRGQKIAAGACTALGALLLAVGVAMMLLSYALFTGGVRTQYSATYDLMAQQQAKISEGLAPLSREAGYDSARMLRAIPPENIMSYSHDRVEWIWRVVLYNDDENQPAWNDDSIRAALLADEGFTERHSPEALSGAVASEAERIVGVIDASVMPIQSMGDRLLLFMGNVISEKRIVFWFVAGIAATLLLGAAALLIPRWMLRKYKPYAELYLGCGLAGVGVILEIVQWVLNTNRIDRILGMLSEQIRSVLGACVAWIMDAMALGGLLLLLLGAGFVIVFFIQRYQIKHFTHHELSPHRF